MTDLIPLGKTDLQITPLGIGAWQWGDRVMWAYGKTHTDDDIHGAFNASLTGGANWFDTAEVYGMGRSEQLLGESVRALQNEGLTAPLVATKFFPFPWRLVKEQLVRALRGSLRRLGLERVDLYQVHVPFPPISVETWAAALADAVQNNLTRAVGVSNYNADQMLRADITLGKRGVPLASNQVHYSLLNRKVERDGLLKLCLERGITLIAYSPLEKGILTGKYTPENLPPGLRARTYTAAYLTKMQPIIRLVQKTAQDCGKTAAQVALNWLICKGAVPIPGAKNAAQAESNTGALGWRLTEEQVAALDAASNEVDGA
jgi:aryl-alcohol dehydrogenase-like predicted oxidoreductase